MVNAPARTGDAIIAAIRRGNFYASCGPQFHAIEFDGTSVHIRTSRVQFVRLVGPGSLGVQLGSFDKKRMTEATIAVPPDWGYVYVEIEDERGRRAWTNGVFA